MPATITEAFNCWWSRSNDVDLVAFDEAIQKQDPQSSLLFVRELFERPCDARMGSILESFIRCTFFPRASVDGRGDADWREKFGADAPEAIEASQVVIGDALFRHDLRPDHFRPGQKLKLWHLPALRLLMIFRLPISQDVLDRLRDRRGRIPRASLRRWVDLEGDLIGLVDWDPPAEIQAALADWAFGLSGYRTLLGDETGLATERFGKP